MEYLLGRNRRSRLAEEDEQWEWDWKRCYLQPEIVSRDLHDRFNSHKLPMKQPNDFQREVEDCIELAATEQEFLAKLEERKAYHVQEVMRAWRSICAILEANSRLLATHNQDGATHDQDGDQYPDKESVDKEIVDHENADKEPGNKGGDEQHNDSYQHGGQGTGNESTAVGSDALPQDGSATPPSLSLFCLDDITSQVVEGRKRRANETCAEMIQERRRQRHAACIASAPTTAESIAPGSLFCAGIWDPDQLLLSRNLPRRPITSQDELQSATAALVADSPLSNPLERPPDRRQHVPGGQGPGVTEVEVIAVTEMESPERESSGLVEITEPSLTRHTIDGIVRETSPATSVREPMDIDASSEDEDVIMTDAALTEHPAPRKSRTAPRGSRRQEKHGAKNKESLREERSTPLQEQASRVRKKQSRRRPAQGTKPPALLDRLLRSTRSSRRDAGHELWYLGDDATALPVTSAG
ncbi:hypothetical protein M440DRAFT_181766 [Trichoderma longibrachiatum ATCC 18648]|uniref:Uncharacterized protein n=1 Tax=Trichoderma longibrachiatum ATCC 18648 TaxID=983965 RepID=A0A2T4CF27_TRILO|nr:hypothetical protein M440DRAFT_181766 [Trichoderma longibrachiatum ATCC 18648]